MTAMLSKLKSFLRRHAGTELADWLAEARTVRGLPVTVYNTRPDVDTKRVFSRLDAALGLIERYQPWHFRRLPRDFARLVVRRFPCRGAYFPDSRTCLIELTFSVNPSFSDAQVAATILHEAMHARLDNAGVQHGLQDAAKHERFCRRAEVEFGMLVPGGEPIVERALASLESADDEVAPVIDWELAGRRVAEADLNALNRPAWLKHAIARRQTRDGAAD